MEKKKRSLPRFQITRDHLANFFTLIITIAIVIVLIKGIFVKIGPIPDDLYTHDSINITLSEGEKFQIESTDSVLAKAESEDYFIIDNGEGTLFSGQPGGFTPNEKYLQSFQIESGVWTVREADITLELTSDKPFSLTVFAVQQSLFSKIVNFILLVIVAIILWIIVMSLMHISNSESRPTI